MYVIQAVIRDGNITGASLVNNTTTYLPADRCHWRQEQVAGTSNYRITNVHYTNGSEAPVNLAGTDNTFQLGYIAKTGRFVGMTV